MKPPQIIMIAMLLLNLPITIYLHGKPKKGNYSMWPDLVDTAFIVWLLVWGGFFADICHEAGEEGRNSK